MAVAPDQEPVLRLAVSLAIAGSLIAAEWLRPARPRTQRRKDRWPVNIGLSVLDTLLARLAAPVLGISAALWAQSAETGLLRLVAAPAPVAFLASIVLLDAAIWAQHLAMHRVRFLWRLHCAHHSDGEVDVTTALRFHPLEILCSAVFKAAVIVGLGAPVAAVVAFEILLNVMALFNHANLDLGERLDRALRRLIVTPALHRAHHAEASALMNANFGFGLSLWDRIFGTYRTPPAAPDFPLGVPSLAPSQAQDLLFVLSLPVRQNVP